MKFIEKPNLPRQKVKCVVCDSRIGDSIEKELNLLGCSILFVPSDNYLDYPISSHPDIHLYHSGDGNFITSGFFFKTFNGEIKKLVSTKDCEIFNNTKEVKKISRGYPNDVPLNVVKVGNCIIGNKDTASEIIMSFDYTAFINVKQGYTKCSVCVVSENAIITDDPGIYQQTKKLLDTLVVKRGEIVLNGYDYGFFGGTCGKISSDTLAFYGKVENFSEYDRISAFCRNHSVYCYSLSNSPLTDYGSLIPILE